jgi:hypothetical protein
VDGAVSETDWTHVVPRDVSSGGAVNGGSVGGGGGGGGAVVSGGGAGAAVVSVGVAVGTAVATGDATVVPVLAVLAVLAVLVFPLFVLPDPVRGAPGAGMSTGAGAVSATIVVAVSNDDTGSDNAGSVDLVGNWARPGCSSTVVAVTTVEVAEPAAPRTVAPVRPVMRAAGTAIGPDALGSSVPGVSSAWAMRPTPASVADTLTPVAIALEARERRLIRPRPMR